MIADKILLHLASQLNLVGNVSIFLGFIPPPAEEGLIVSDGGGVENETGMGRYLIQLATIKADYISGMQLCTSAYDELIFSNGFTVSGLYVFQCEPLSAPKFVTLNEKGKPIITATVVAHTERS